MKNLYIMFGGSVDHYHNWFRVTYEIEKKLGIVFRRTGAEKFEGKKENVNIKIRFCWNPTRDKNYYEMKRYNETNFKSIVAIPADELSKRIKNPSVILFLGLCGGFKGKKGDIYLPEEFGEIFFEEKIIREKEVLEIKPKNKIKIKNYLKGKMKGLNGRVVTSNLTLMPKNIENEDKEILIKLTKNLIREGDLVDKESYQIVNEFKKECPVGVLMLASDILIIKKHMLNPLKFNPIKNKIRNSFTEAVNVMVGGLK